MKLFKLTLATLIVFRPVHIVCPQIQSGTPWVAATYHGLVMGKSTRADVLKLLGKPKWVGREQDTGVPIISYEVADPVPGSLTVYIKNGILESLALDPKTSLVKSDIIHRFGPGYMIVHYSADECLDEGGAAPIYEDTKGPFMHMEYRNRGLAALFFYNNDEKVETIVFTHQPFGPTHSLCAKRGKKK